MMKQAYFSRPLLVPLLAGVGLVVFILMSFNWQAVNDYYLACTLGPGIENTIGVTAHYVHLQPAIPWPSADVVAVKTVRHGSIAEMAGLQPGDVPLHPYTLWPGTNLGAFYAGLANTALLPPSGLPFVNASVLDTRWRKHVRYIHFPEHSKKTGT